MLKDKKLETYWIRSPQQASLGFGITAFSIEDALFLLKQAGYSVDIAIPGTTVKEGVSFSDLDRRHVIPNMGLMTFRGVWYPSVYL